MRGIHIGRVFGIPIRLNWTFLIILPVFAYIIGSDIGIIGGILNDSFGAGIDIDVIESGSTRWILGLAAAIGLFAGVLLHEFGHSLVAMRYGFEIESITLWLLGGLANFKEMPEDWKQEFWIAIAGPIVSVLVGIVSFVGFVLTPAGFDGVIFVLGYLALLNIVLAAFNMLPGFPMDGGRVLRALLARNQPHAKATQQAAEVGKFFAFILGLIGLFAFNVILILLAFFIYIAASGEAQQTALKAAFEGVTVGDLMTPRSELKTVASTETVAQLFERMVRERHTGYPVVENGELVGIVTLDDARDVRQVERDAYLIEDVMSTDIASTTVGADALSALQTMQEHDIGRLPVLDEAGRLVGIVSRTDMMTAFNVIKSGGSPGALGGESLRGAFDTGNPSNQR